MGLPWIVAYYVGLAAGLVVGLWIGYHAKRRA